MQKILIPEINRQKTICWVNPVFEITSWIVNVPCSKL